jgi:hypothetical protein
MVIRLGSATGGQWTATSRWILQFERGKAHCICDVTYGGHFERSKCPLRNIPASKDNHAFLKSQTVFHFEYFDPWRWTVRCLVTAGTNDSQTRHHNKNNGNLNTSKTPAELIMIVIKTRHYFPKKNKLVVLSNEGVVCLLWGRTWSVLYYTGPGNQRRRSDISKCMWITGLRTCVIST